jgi:citrate lyase subunit beta/citryl-CoA lyase
MISPDRMHRSWLFVPGDNPRKIDKAFGAGADALILDLEDSIALPAKALARRTVLGALREAPRGADAPALYVRVNSDSALNQRDLDMVMAGAPDGIMLPKAEGGADIQRLSARLAVLEASHQLADGSTKIVALVTETAAAMFSGGTYRGADPRLAGLSWGAEDLSAEIGALASRDETGAWTPPFQLARSICLFAAAAALVPAIDTVFVDFRDEAGLARECAAAFRDGFSGKLAIHPAQVPIINEGLTPSAAQLDHARRVVAAFAASGDAGVTALDGRMLDRPHLVAAQRILGLAAGSQPRPDGLFMRKSSSTTA